jgi:hypothetical protein
VTGTLTVRYLLPSELDKPILLRAHVTELHPRKALVLCSLYSGEMKSAEGEVVAVRFNMDKALGSEPGHPQNAEC